MPPIDHGSRRDTAEAIKAALTEARIGPDELAALQYLYTYEMVTGYREDRVQAACEAARRITPTLAAGLSAVAEGQP